MKENYFEWRIGGCDIIHVEEKTVINIERRNSMSREADLEVFTPRRVFTSQPRVAILPTGAFRVNSAGTKSFFEGYKRTFLLFDRKARVVGFRPSNEEKGTYALTRPRGVNYVTIAGTAFLKYYGIAHGQRTSYEVSWDKNQKVAKIGLNHPL